MPKDETRYIGVKFGKWTVIDDSTIRGGRRYCKCKCECGNEKEVRLDSLKRGDSTSCTCSMKGMGATHGLSRDPLYNNWRQMLWRCENPNSHKYSTYGGRGIKICDEWHDPKKFVEWAESNGYKEGLTLDRIDVDGDYCPENCRYVSNKVQSRNTRYNKVICYKGEYKCVAEWAELFKLEYDTLWMRLKRGWTIEDALEKPIRKWR